MLETCSSVLSAREIHIWTVLNGASDAIAARFERVLSSNEQDRAARFRFSHLRRSFIIVHGALRFVLARYLGIHPASIRFVYGSNGKPSLVPAVGIEFNLTHSGDLAAVALTADCRIGIDIEQIRPVSDMEQVANRFFCREEAAEILSLPQNEREQAFFRCWTRKEAYIKAIGDGLSAPLDGFRVTVRANEPARFIHIGHESTIADEWMLHDLCLVPGHAGALAYRDKRRSVSILPIVEPADLLGMP